MKIPGLSLLREFGSLIGRLNSLLGRLGNLPGDLRYSNRLPARNRARSGPKAAVCQYLPIHQGNRRQIATTTRPQTPYRVRQANPATVSPTGLYSQPTQPA
jgi:hypothetical protein